MRANEDIVTSNDDEKAKNANETRKKKKLMVDDIVVEVNTKIGYVLENISTVLRDAAVTIGGKHSTYKVSNNFCTNKRKQKKLSSVKMKGTK